MHVVVVLGAAAAFILTFMARWSFSAKKAGVFQEHFTGHERGRLKTPSLITKTNTTEMLPELHLLVNAVHPELFKL